MGAVSDDRPDELLDVGGDDGESCSVAVILSTVMAKPSYQPVLFTTLLTVAGALDEVVGAADTAALVAGAAVVGEAVSAGLR